MGIDLLLHRAISSRAISVDMLQLVMNAYPDGIRQKDGRPSLPLSLAVDFDVPFDCFRLILSRYPDAARVREEWDVSLPLHQCLEHGKSEALVSSLLDVYPQAASTNTRFRETALHLACNGGFSLAIVRRLYQLYPEAVTVQDTCTELPLHSACEAVSSSVQVVEFLLEKYPEGAQSRNEWGRLPLHCAARKASTEVVQFLIEIYSNAVHVTDNHGLLPLHWACSYGASLEVIQLLLAHFDGDERHHSGLNITDNNGLLPIHLCTMQDPRLSDIFWILTQEVSMSLTAWACFLFTMLAVTMQHLRSCNFCLIGILATNGITAD